MRDITELNDVLDGDDDEPIVQPKYDGWDQCKVQVQCVFADQVPTKSVEGVVLLSLPGVGPIGFIAETLADLLKAESSFCEEMLPGIGIQCHDHDSLVDISDQIEPDPCDDCRNNDVGLRALEIYILSVDGDLPECLSCPDNPIHDISDQIECGPEVDLYEEAFKPDPDGCGCGRDDCYNCNLL